MPSQDVQELESIHRSMASALSPPTSDAELQGEEELYQHPLLAPFVDAETPPFATPGGGLAAVPADLLDAGNPTPSPALDARWLSS